MAPSRFSDIWRFLPDAVVVASPDGGLRTVNSHFERLYGYSAAETSSLTLSELGIDGTALSEHGSDSRLRHRDGRLIPVRVSGGLVDVDGCPGLLIVIRDLSEQSAAADYASRSALLYEAVSASNRAVIFSTDQAEMFRRICQACTDFGMKLAWVGLSRDGVMTPVCISGSGAEYLENVQISLDESSDRGRGPTGTAARTGRVVLCNDFLNDPRTAPWHERGEKFGWHASAAFPLFRQGVVVGALTLYSDLPGYFGDREVRLLDELAHDISFALDRFESERQRVMLERELQASRLQIIRSLGRAGEYRDNETGAHILRMSYYCQAVAIAAGLGEDFARILLQASPMHDVGKIGIPDSILLKPGKLEPDEFEIMKGHVLIGAEILSDADNQLLQMARAVALTHHEKWDGSGYPHGLQGEEIPIEGRIAAICDVFDALTSRRCYKQPWPLDQAIDFMRSNASAHFDPSLVGVFLEILPEILNIQSRFLDTAEG